MLVPSFRFHLCCKQGQNTGATPNIQNYLSLEQMPYSTDGILIAACPDSVLEHLLMDSYG